MYQVIINSNNELGRLLNSKLINSGINSTISNNIVFINKNPNALVITIENSKNIEIIYSIKRNNRLANLINDSLEKNNYKVSKVYQRRNSKNTNQDYDDIIKKLPNNESIILRLPTTNVKNISEILTNTIKDYLGVSNIIYVVKKDDNLYSIARKYNTTVDNIKRDNNLKSNKLSIGQKLIIKPITNNITYKVKKGDTLYSIASKYNVSVKDIMNLNKMSNTRLSINQILYIPKKV